MRFTPIVLFLLLASTLAVGEPAPKSAEEGKPSKQTAVSQKNFALQFDQVHSITYEQDGMTITRYFKIVPRNWHRMRLIEVDGLEGNEIPMPILRKIHPNMIAKDEDDYNINPSSDGKTDTWVLRTTGFFFAQLTMKRDAPTRPQLIPAANGLSYRYYGANPFMERIVTMPGPNGERAIEVKVWNKTDSGYKLVRTVDCEPPAEASSEKRSDSSKKDK